MLNRHFYRIAWRVFKLGWMSSNQRAPYWVREENGRGLFRSGQSTRASLWLSHAAMDHNRICNRSFVLKFDQLMSKEIFYKILLLKLYNITVAVLRSEQYYINLITFTWGQLITTGYITTIRHLVQDRQTVIYKYSL